MSKSFLTFLSIISALFAVGQQPKVLSAPIKEIKDQILIIEPGADYALNENLLYSPGSTKTCVLFNFFLKNQKVANSVEEAQALVVVKVFLDSSFEKSQVKVNPDTLKNSIRSRELISQAGRVVASHLLLKVTNLIQKGGEESTLSNITVVVKRDKEYYRIKAEALCQFFYILDYKQTSIQQSNLTIINTQATIGDHSYFHFNKLDSIAAFPRLANDSPINEPMPDFQAKIFLERKNSDGSFRFYRKHISSADIPFRGIEEFDYLPGFGITSFASKVPWWSPMGELDETRGYYRFIKNKEESTTKGLEK